jgi:hypothetical protein
VRTISDGWFDKFVDLRMNFIGAHICSIIITKISLTDKIYLFANPLYMRCLLHFVDRWFEKENDSIMYVKYPLYILWNITEESSKICELFQEKEGIKEYFCALDKFVGQSDIEHAILCTLKNIFDVFNLKCNFMKLEYLKSLRKLMHSNQSYVSYFAVGISANLCIDSTMFSKYNLIDLNSILEEMLDSVKKWRMHDKTFVTYKSLQSFEPLLNCSESYSIQLYAIWSINNLCNEDPKHYCNKILSQL